MTIFLVLLWDFLELATSLLKDSYQEGAVNLLALYF